MKVCTFKIIGNIRAADHEMIVCHVTHLEGVQVELHMQGLAGASHAIEAAGLSQQAIIELPPEARPGVLGLPQQHPSETPPHPRRPPLHQRPAIGTWRSIL